MKIGIFKSKTNNGRSAKTSVKVTPQHGIVVINQRILAHVDDLESGWFSKHHPISPIFFGNYVLLEIELCLWPESYNLVNEIVTELRKEI